MTGYEFAQYFSQSYFKSRLIYISVGIVIMFVFSFLYLRKRKQKPKKREEKKAHTKTLQTYLAIVVLLGIAVALSIPKIISCWQDNRQHSFLCVEGTYERDFVASFNKHPITITDDSGEVFSLYVAVGYSTEDSLISAPPVNEAFPKGTFDARVYYGKHSGLAFYMEVIG